MIEDDESTRQLLRTVLEDAGYAVIDLDRGERAVEVVRKERPALVLVDVRLPGVSGYEVCRKLREAFGGDLPILFVSGERTEAFDRVGGLLLGADDYLVKPFAPDELLARLRGLTRRAPGGTPPVSKLLSARELEVLRLLSLGLGLKEIAEHLVISAKTVSTHVEHIFLKLGVQSRAQAVAVAYRENLVSSAKTETAPPRAVTERVSSSPTRREAPEAPASAVPIVSATPLIAEVPTNN